MAIKGWPRHKDTSEISSVAIDTELFIKLGMKVEGKTWQVPFLYYDILDYNEKGENDGGNKYVLTRDGEIVMTKKGKPNEGRYLFPDGPIYMKSCDGEYSFRADFIKGRLYSLSLWDGTIPATDHWYLRRSMN